MVAQGCAVATAATYVQVAAASGISLVVTWLSLGALCSVAVYAAERDTNSSIKGPLDALWWGVGAMTTVGSDVFPTTVQGRIAAMALMLIGAFILAAITATITSVLLGVGKSSLVKESTSLASEIEHLVLLRDRGELTSEEFVSAKQRALAS